VYRAARRRQIQKLEKELEAHVVSGVAFDFGKWADLQMLAALEGCGRTEMEYRALHSTTGFDLQEVVVNASPLTLLVAKPV